MEMFHIRSCFLINSILFPFTLRFPYISFSVIEQYDTHKYIIS